MSAQDLFEIQQTINIYHQSASLADWPATAATFLPDGVWIIIRAGKRFDGQAAIRAAFETFTAPLEYVAQINAPALITLAGDTATARSAIRETGKYRGKNEAFEAFGIYTDKLVRTPAGWKFAERSFATSWLHKVPTQPA